MFDFVSLPIPAVTSRLTGDSIILLLPIEFAERRRSKKCSMVGIAPPPLHPHPTSSHYPLTTNDDSNNNNNNNNIKEVNSFNPKLAQNSAYRNSPLILLLSELNTFRVLSLGEGTWWLDW